MGDGGSSTWLLATDCGRYDRKTGSLTKLRDFQVESSVKLGLVPWPRLAGTLRSLGPYPVAVISAMGALVSIHREVHGAKSSREKSPAKSCACTSWRKCAAAASIEITRDWLEAHELPYSSRDTGEGNRGMGFVPIAIDKYVQLHVQANRDEDPRELLTRLRSCVSDALVGARCSCGPPHQHSPARRFLPKTRVQRDGDDRRSQRSGENLIALDSWLGSVAGRALVQILQPGLLAGGSRRYFGEKRVDVCLLVFLVITRSPVVPYTCGTPCRRS